MSVGPLRFRVVADEIVEQGGQTLATLNLECIPSILDDFTLFIDSVGEFGATDEIEEFLYPNEEALSADALTKYQEMRERLAERTIGGLVPLPIALLILREALETQGDDEDTPVTEEVDGEGEEHSEEFEHGNEEGRSSSDNALYPSEQLGHVSGDGGNVEGGAAG